MDDDVDDVDVDDTAPASVAATATNAPSMLLLPLLQPSSWTPLPIIIVV